MKKLILLIACGLFFANLIWAQDVFDREIVLNGDFEYQLENWACTNCNEDENIAYDDVFSTHYLALGNLNETEEARQIVAISEDTGKVKFSYDCELVTADSLDNDYFSFSIENHDTGEVYIKDNVFPSDNTTACYYSYNLADYAGQTIDIVFSVSNDDSDLTYAAIDDVTLVGKSYSKLKGRVFDKHYNKLKNATVIIKRFNGERIWKGKTNNNGIFHATHLKGHAYQKARIIFKKNEVREKYYRYLDWGTSYQRTFNLKNI